MIRAQIYLTSDERKQLHLLSNESGKSQSELIREAIDLFIDQKISTKKNKVLLIQGIKGMWSERDDLPDFAKLRTELDRNDSSGDSE